MALGCRAVGFCRVFWKLSHTREHEENFPKNHTGRRQGKIKRLHEVHSTHGSALASAPGSRMAGRKTGALMRRLKTKPNAYPETPGPRNCMRTGGNTRACEKCGSTPAVLHM